MYIYIYIPIVNVFSHADYISPWWRHQMETFSALLAICAGNSPVPGEFPTQRPVTRSFDVYFDLRPNKRLSKQSLGWWFETLSPPLWRHRNAINTFSLFTFSYAHTHTHMLGIAISLCMSYGIVYMTYDPTFFHLRTIGPGFHASPNDRTVCVSLDAFHKWFASS